MEIDVAAKVLALLVGIIGLPKLFHEFSERRLSRLKDQLNISKELASSSGSQTHPLVVQSAYAALTGRKPLRPTTIQRLMLLEQPLRAFFLYHEGEDFLQPTTGKRLPFKFKPIYSDARTRRWLLIRFSVLYFLFAVLATAPLLFAKQLFPSISGYTLLGLAAWAVIFIWLAKIVLDRFGGLLAAQKLVRIRLARSNNSFKPKPLRGSA